MINRKIDPMQAEDPSKPSPQTSTLRNIFTGADGLRAGWSLLVFVALMAVILFAAFRLHLLPKSAGNTFTPGSMFLDESIPLFATFLVTWIMSRIERRPISVYGLGGRRKLALFITGLILGVSFLSLLVLLLNKSGLLVFNARLLSGSAIFYSGAIWLAAFLFVGMLEEYLTRGYLLFTLSRGLTAIYRLLFKTRHSPALGFWTAAVLLSFLFGLGHTKNPGESPIGLLSAGLASLVFCLSLWRTGSLWWAIGLHSAWDWSQSFLYGVADSGMMASSRLFATHPVGKPLLSGGATGPEGSIYVLLVLALLTVIILTLLPRPRTETQTP